MISSETTALRMVEGGELYLRRAGDSRWRVEFYDRIATAAVHTINRSEVRNVIASNHVQP